MSKSGRISASVFNYLYEKSDFKSIKGLICIVLLSFFCVCLVLPFIVLAILLMQINGMPGFIPLTFFGLQIIYTIGIMIFSIRGQKKKQRRLTDYAILYDEAGLWFHRRN